MAVSAQESSSFLKNSVFFEFRPLTKYQKVTKILSCTKFNLKTFLLLSKKIFSLIKI